MAYINGLETMFSARIGSGLSVEDIRELCFPVGITVQCDTSPASFMGGTWEQIKDRVLIGAGGSYAKGATGGNTYMQLSAAIGAYDSNTASLGYCATGPIRSLGFNYGIWGTDNHTNISSDRINHSTTVYDWVQGTTTPSLLPPYLAVNMWKRIA